MNAIRAARAFSGKTMLAKCEGAYHGNHDAVQISVTPVVGMAGDAESPDAVLMTRGMTPRSADEIVIMPYNDLENAEKDDTGARRRVGGSNRGADKRSVRNGSRRS